MNKNELSTASGLLCFLPSLNYMLMLPSTSSNTTTATQLSYTAFIAVVLSLVLKILDELFVCNQEVTGNKHSIGKVALNVLGRISQLVLAVTVWNYNKDATSRLVALASALINFIDSSETTIEREMAEKSKKTWRKLVDGTLEILSKLTSFWTTLMLTLQGLGLDAGSIPTLTVISAILAFFAKSADEFNRIKKEDESKAQTTIQEKMKNEAQKIILNFLGRAAQVTLAFVIKFKCSQDLIQCLIYLAIFVNAADAAAKRKENNPTAQPSVGLQRQEPSATPLSQSSSRA
ncbi:MAG: hypothetical protein P4M11_12515 [Candidatus Pacebacteria bacterium]|nr:hypothetical protein [Candidatus Paceibacterota bacterium]